MNDQLKKTVKESSPKYAKIKLIAKQFKKEFSEISGYYKTKFLFEKNTFSFLIYIGIILLIGAFLHLSYSLGKEVLMNNLGNFSNSMYYVWILILLGGLYGFMILLVLFSRKKSQINMSSLLLIASLLVVEKFPLVMGFSWGLLLFFMAPDFSSNYKDFSWKPIILILVMMLTFFGGMIMIQEVYGVEDWSYKINYNNSESIDLNCYGYKEKVPFILGYNSKCTILNDTLIKNYSGYIKIKTVSNKIELQNISNNIEFVMSKEMPDSIFLNLTIYDYSNNESLPLTSIWEKPFAFHSLEEYRETRRSFFTQFFTLLAIVLLTIPFAGKKILEYLKL